jgi:hypothetical protein
MFESRTGKRDKEEVEVENKKKACSKALHDGSPCMAIVDEEETLVYFALANERENKSFEFR